MLPSHNCIIIINVQFSRYIFEFQETQWSILFPRYFSQFLDPTFKIWDIRYEIWDISKARRYLISSISYLISFKKWWAKMDSNHRPHDYQSCALASWAIGPFLVEISGIEPLTSCLQGRRSPSWAKPPNLPSLLPGTSGNCQLLIVNSIQAVPSKLNNASISKTLFWP